MYKFILPVRYLFKRRISYFAVAAVALCVFVTVVVITVLSGLTAQFKRNTYLSVGDCVISSKSLVGFAYYDEFIEILEDTDFVEAVSPVIKNYALVSSTVESGTAADLGPSRTEIVGIDAAPHSRVTGFGRWLYYHRDSVSDAFKPSYGPELAGCVVGVGRLFARDSQGSYNVAPALSRVRVEVSCFPLTARGALAKAGTGQVSTKSFYCSDYVHSGLVQIDGGLIYLPFDQAQMLCGMGMAYSRVSAIHIKFKPGVGLGTGCEKVERLWQGFVEKKAGARHARLLENVRVQSWKTYSRVVIAAVETERTMMMIIFAMVGIITVFIIFVVFYMIISHKSKDIGILKSVGVSNVDVLRLFLRFAFLVGVVGSVIGAVGGWRFLVHINQIESWLFEHFRFQLWDRTIFAIGDIPNQLQFRVLAAIVLSAIAASLLGAVIPSWQAARAKPVDTLQVSQL